MFSVFVRNHQVDIMHDFARLQRLVGIVDAQYAISIRNCPDYLQYIIDRLVESRIILVAFHLVVLLAATVNRDLETAHAKTTQLFYPFRSELQAVGRHVAKKSYMMAFAKIFRKPRDFDEFSVSQEGFSPKPRQAKFFYLIFQKVFFNVLLDTGDSFV